MLKTVIDWFEFTMLDTQLSDAFKVLDLKWEQFKQLPKGRFGYRSQYKWNEGNVFVMFNVGNVDDKNINLNTRINQKSGVHVMITGTGCRQFSIHHSLNALVRTLSALERVNFSRIDLAIDDYESKIISYDRIHDAALDGHFTSRWSKWDEITSRQSSTNEYLGRTMYFGSQASDLFCRIYDKTLERKANDNLEIDTKWTRLELVYKKDRAKKLIEFLVKKDNIGHALKGSLKQYIRFLTPTKDSNKARWPTAPWWEKLLAGVEKLKLTVKKEAKTIEDMTAWVDKQIAPTMAAILKAQEGDMSWLRGIIIKGAERLSQRHQDAINQYLAREEIA